MKAEDDSKGEKIEAGGTNGPTVSNNEMALVMLSSRGTEEVAEESSKEVKEHSEGEGGAPWSGSVGTMLFRFGLGSHRNELVSKVETSAEDKAESGTKNEGK